MYCPQGTPKLTPQSDEGATAPQPDSPAPASNPAARDGADVLDCLFSSGNPKHALQGLGSGLYNVAAGLALGATGMVASTVAGGYDGGAVGVAKGLGVGLGGLVGMTLYGTYAGCRQVVKGFVNTPTAIQHSARGDQFWDSSRQAWVDVCLEKDLEDLPGTDADLEAAARLRFEELEKDSGRASANAECCSDSPPQEGSSETGPDYYAIIGVEKTANANDIKRAFTRQALLMHPDKNPNDPEATRKFQGLMAAYNTLCDPTARAYYDAHGADTSHMPPEASAAAAAAANPMSEILGTQFLEPLLGQLNFMRYFQVGVSYSDEMLIELHRRRRVRIARNLLFYLDGGESGLAQAGIIFSDAVSTRCGPQLLTAVANAYQTASRQYLCGHVVYRELDSWWSSKSQSIHNAYTVATRGATTALKAVRHTVSEEDVLNLLAIANESDVSRTVLQACRLCLMDSSASPEVRRHRAERLQELYHMVLAEVQRETAARLAVPMLQNPL